MALGSGFGEIITGADEVDRDAGAVQIMQAHLVLASSFAVISEFLMVLQGPSIGVGTSFRLSAFIDDGHRRSRCRGHRDFWSKGGQHGDENRFSIRNGSEFLIGSNNASAYLYPATVARL